MQCYLCPRGHTCFALQTTLLPLGFRLAASVHLLVHFTQLTGRTKPQSFQRRHDGTVPIGAA